MKGIVKTAIFLCLIVFSAQEAFSQKELVKSWEGTLNVSGMTFRILFHITQDEQGKLSATMDSPDQGARGIPVSSISYANSVIKLEVASAGGVYEGIVNDDYTRIKGEWKQMGNSIPLSLTPVDESKPKQELNFFSNWRGDLNTGVSILKLDVRFFKAGEDSVGVFLDSPAQGVKDLPASSVYYGEDSVFFEIKVIGGRFSGKFNEDKTKINGTWEQGVLNAPLILFNAGRPQEPKKPYPYIEEEITFESKEDSITLAGTLTYPKERTGLPAVVLLTGSGPQNRNEELHGHKPFLVWSDYLTRNGFAVLRFDDRGVGKSAGNFYTALIPDFVSDAMAAVEYLKSRKEVNDKKIGIIGHSEGGLVAPMAANKSDDISFIVLAAGPGVSGKEIILRQTELIARSRGISENEIKEEIGTMQQVFEVLTTIEDSAEADRKITQLGTEYINALSEEERNKPEYSKEALEQQKNFIMNPSFRYFLKYDPEEDIAKLKIPVLALFGEKDLQVPPSQNKDEMVKALEKSQSKNYKVMVMPGMNHLFQESQTGSLDEYAKIDQTVSPKMLETMGDWLKEVVK